MNWLKFILILLAILLGAWAVFAVIGIVYSAIWYLFILGIIGIGGYVAYQLFKPEPKQIEGKTPTSQISIGIDENEKLLEEIKRKYLEK